MSIPDFAARLKLFEDVARFVRKRIFDGTYSAGEYVCLAVTVSQPRWS
jgi:hypothetical protein